MDDFYAENLSDWLRIVVPVPLVVPSMDSCLNATLLSGRMCNYMMDRGHLDWF